MKNIVFIVDSINNLGGAEISTIDLIKLLSKENNVKVISFCEEKFTRIDDFKNVRHLVLKRKKTKLPISYISCLNIHAIYQIINILKGLENIDFIFIGNINHYISFFIIPVSKLFSRNVVHIIRDTYLTCAGKKFLNDKEIKFNFYIKNNLFQEFLRLKLKFNPLRRFLSIYFASFATRLITNSYAMKDYLAKYGLKTTTIHNSVEISNANIVLNNLGDENKPLKIFWPARISPYKGFVTVIKLAEMIKKRKNNWSIGITTTENDFIKLSKDLNFKDIPTNIIFHGWQDHKKVMETISESDIIIYPSIYLEPFGRVPIEAMSMGKIVMISGLGGLKEIITHNHDGFIINPNNIEQFYTYIKNLISDYEYSVKIRINAVDTVKKKFCLERLEKDYYKLLNELN